MYVYIMTFSGSPTKRIFLDPTFFWAGDADTENKFNQDRVGICKRKDIIIYFENVAFFHTKPGSDVCPKVRRLPQGRQPKLR